MPSNILSDLQTAYRNALEKTAGDPIRPLSLELKASFTTAVEELNELQQVADDSRERVGNLLATIPESNHASKNADAVRHYLPGPDPAYEKIAAIERDLEARLARNDA